MSYSNPDSIKPNEVVKWIGVAFGVVCLFIVLSLGGCAGINAFSRAQKRADANNNVTLTNIQIRNQTQYARVIAAHNATVKAKAYQRYLESVGIRRAQDEISRTLTPLYIQHEAIQALESVANSGRNNTVVYVPSGPNGVPLVTANAGQGK